MVCVLYRSVVNGMCIYQTHKLGECVCYQALTAPYVGASGAKVGGETAIETSDSLIPIWTITFGLLLSSCRLPHLSGDLRSNQVMPAAQNCGNLLALRTLRTVSDSAKASAF